jgi:replicative DNA helicase
MNLDLNLISAIVYEKDFLRAQDKGIRGSHIVGTAEVQIWKFIHDYFNEYRTTPAADIIKQKFDVVLPSVSESLNYWIDEVRKRTLFNDMNEMFASISEKIAKDDPTDAYAALRTFVKEKELDLSSELQIKEVTDLKGVFIQRYEDAKAGKRGIDTPWETMNQWTMGWWPKDLSFVIARSGVGKTFWLLCAAIAALKAGKSVLFVSCEMSTDDLASRFYSMMFKKQYSAVRKGRLSFFEEGEMKRQIEEFESTNKLEIMDAERGLDIIRIERAIERSRADLVLVDSAYRIKPRQKARDRFEAMSYVVDDLKSFAQLYQKPIVATTQVNREGGKKKSSSGMGQEDVAMSDVINWNSTNIFGLAKVGEEGDQTRLAIYPIKVRESENAQKPLIVHWDFVSMNFSEIGVGEGAAASNDDDDGDRNW